MGELVNPYYKGLNQQPNYANAIVGAAGLFANTYGMANQRYNYSSPMDQQGSDGAPMYTGGQLATEIQNTHPKGAQGGEILSGAGQGAAIGTQIMPGWGTLIGAGVGALSSVIGGGDRKFNQQWDKIQAQRRLGELQQNYNYNSNAFRNQQNQLYDYYNRNNAEGREYNVYKTRLAQ